jgi:hypothetical protein
MHGKPGRSTLPSWLCLKLAASFNSASARLSRIRFTDPPGSKGALHDLSHQPRLPLHQLPGHRLPVQLRSNRSPAGAGCSSGGLRLRHGLRLRSGRARLPLPLPGRVSGRSKMQLVDKLAAQRREPRIRLRCIRVSALALDEIAVCPPAGGAALTAALGPATKVGFLARPRIHTAGHNVPLARVIQCGRWERSALDMGER